MAERQRHLTVYEDQVGSTPIHFAMNRQYGKGRSHRFVRYWTMKGSELLRKLHRLARRRGVPFRYEPGLGKRSHGRVWLETAATTLKDPKKELGAGLSPGDVPGPGN